MCTLPAIYKALISKPMMVRLRWSIAELKPNIVKTYGKSSDVINMFTSGEIAAANLSVTLVCFGVPTIQAADDSLVFVAPDGTYANFNLISIIKIWEQRTASYEYINYRLSAELQKKTAGWLNEAPTNGLVERQQKNLQPHLRWKCWKGSGNGL